MKMQDEIGEILHLVKNCHNQDKAIENGTKQIMRIIRAYENELVQANAMLESIEELLDGKEVSEFMESFPIVRKVSDLIAMAIERKITEPLSPDNACAEKE